MSSLADWTGAGYMKCHEVYVVSGAMPQPVVKLLWDYNKDDAASVRQKENGMFVIPHIGCLHQWWN